MRITFNVTADYFYNEDNATINADNFNVTAGYDFYNQDSATINADNFNVTAGDRFFNQDIVQQLSADNFNVTTDNFYNYDGCND